MRLTKLLKRQNALALRRAATTDAGEAGELDLELERVRHRIREIQDVVGGVPKVKLVEVITPSVVAWEWVGVLAGFDGEYRHMITWSRGSHALRYGTKGPGQAQWTECTIRYPASFGFTPDLEGARRAATAFVGGETDSGVNQVEEVTPGGVQTTAASGFNLPEGVAVDASGNVYVADTYNNRVVVGPAPSITSFSPTSGPVGTVVTIKGTNLFGANKVKVNGVTATITKDTATKIKIKLSAGATTGKIKVTTPLGKAKTATVFTVT
jgi:hypothetical protein